MNFAIELLERSASERRREIAALQRAIDKGGEVPQNIESWQKHIARLTNEAEQCEEALRRLKPELF